MMETRRQATGKIASLVLFALFIVAMLLALVAGVRVYGALSAQEDDIRAERFTHGLVANAVRGADAWDAVAEGAGPEGPALCLVERGLAGTFETRFYLFEGNLMQEYTLQGMPCTPETATPVIATSEFWFTYEDGLLTLGTDSDETTVALRCAQKDGQL